ncbi:MAG: hypothetical protein JKX97_09250 [Candidatus Lindowbacteria bacterium]|nr:hypothetical protein [Candidatus Lindowbacteria bacterium]
MTGVKYVTLQRLINKIIILTTSTMVKPTAQKQANNSVVYGADGPVAVTSVKSNVKLGDRLREEFKKPAPTKKKTVTSNGQKLVLKPKSNNLSKAVLPKTTISQATAAMSKGATPVMKKGALDRQFSFINDVLYDRIDKLGAEMELSDCQFIYYFYHTYLKEHLEKELDRVKLMKTGGANPPHLSHFVPFNKFMQIAPDIVELALDIRSMKQLKFYKMLIYRIMECSNKALQSSGFKGKMYMKKNFYSSLQTYWEEKVAPVIEADKKKREDDNKTGEVQEEVADIAMIEDAGEEEEELAESPNVARSEDEEEEEEQDDEVELVGVTEEEWYGQPTQPIL